MHTTLLHSRLSAFTLPPAFGLCTGKAFCPRRCLGVRPSRTIACKFLLYRLNSTLAAVKGVEAVAIAITERFRPRYGQRFEHNLTSTKKYTSSYSGDEQIGRCCSGLRLKSPSTILLKTTIIFKRFIKNAKNQMRYLSYSNLRLCCVQKSNNPTTRTRPRTSKTKSKKGINTISFREKK